MITATHTETQPADKLADALDESDGQLQVAPEPEVAELDDQLERHGEAVAAAKMGIGQSTVSDSVKTTMPCRRTPNSGSGNRRTPDQRRKLTPRQRRRRTGT